MLAKERTSQLNAGDSALVPQDNDKNTVISLREIGEGKVSVKALRESAINKLRKHQRETTELEELNDEHEDNFDKIYKGEISKSGTAVLPSKRAKRMPEKINSDYTNLMNKSDSNNKETKQQEDPKETKQQEDPESLPADKTSKE